MTRSDLPRLIGHRGAAGLAPENTMAAFRAAHAAGCRWVEFDCMLTRDGEIVVHHDDAIDRTTNGTGLMSDIDLAALKTLDAGAWFDPAFAGQRVPTLAEIVALLAELGMGANVEIKPVTGHETETGIAVARFLTASWPENLPPPVVSSFSLAALDAARREGPGLDIAILWEDVPGDWHDHHIRLKASAVHTDAARVSDASIAAFRDADIPFRCYTVNDPDRASALFAKGCQSVFTDFPDRLAQV
ncbi:glycerophosphodiester phosphodiesterase [Rhodospirillaceae bacterium KN72]|uniref:Glycerophosphodiester phosphodiesterase n=1 Tax=Pacificispira spongiicola TaxID=2729598 RepID=A0A7Y0DZR0_9PROT|nr:glycerophosphodiester phosphodiesterase family protein [Pacificispira spongiicola]NMM44584.1 glycerophosphodiester phosphodiesterase [Pacificispira spongiicola]